MSDIRLQTCATTASFVNNPGARLCPKDQPQHLRFDLKSARRREGRCEESPPLKLQFAKSIPESGTAPRPCLWVQDQTRGHRVVLDISAGLQFVRAIPHEGIPIVSLPEFPVSLQQAVCF